jgi:1-acyl-sn-glycerol-3-phosphate acyltransferase
VDTTATDAPAHGAPIPRLQVAVGRSLAPLWLPLAVGVMYFVRGWRIADAAPLRREYQRLRRESDAPLLVCANHLTLVDSALIAWALGSPWWYMRHFSALPWNLPERANFTRSIWQRIAVYLMKCLPITRGGERGEVAEVLAQFTALLASGEVGLLFPEGGRSRTGRVDLEAATYGVGRVVKSLPGCRVLCVYLRGEHQSDWSDLPPRGDVFHASLSCFEPHSERSGLRGSLEIGHQILTRLDEMERRHFEARAA